MIVRAAAVISAGMRTGMIVVRAAYIRIVVQAVVQERSDRIVRAARYAAKQLNAGLSKSVLSAAADSTADQHIHVVGSEPSAESAVSGAFSRQDFRIDDTATVYFIQLEFFRMTEVLKDLTVIVRYRYVHSILLCCSVWNTADVFCSIRRSCHDWDRVKTVRRE